ncbi:hypothetical protein LJC61_09700, partial [Ruminococcaceae bacterium OttesenSCG-928-A16]|nr:hypothetical protein [Ruminococcaceae bacterium OttesenSCG-928-A16]
EEFKMPNLNELVGKTIDEATKYCDDRSIPHGSPVIVENDGSKTEGTVASIEYTSNVVVTDGTVVVIKVYGAAPTPPPASTPTPPAA